MNLRNLSDATAFGAALLLVFVMLMVGSVAPVLLSPLFVVFVAAVLAARFGGQLTGGRRLA